MTQIGMTQIGMTQIGMTQIGMTQIGMTQIGMTSRCSRSADIPAVSLFRPTLQRGAGHRVFSGRGTWGEGRGRAHLCLMVSDTGFV